MTFRWHFPGWHPSPVFCHHSWTLDCGPGSEGSPLASLSCFSSSWSRSSFSSFLTGSFIFLMAVMEPCGAGSVLWGFGLSFLFIFFQFWGTSLSDFSHQPHTTDPAQGCCFSPPAPCLFMLPEVLQGTHFLVASCCRQRQRPSFSLSEACKLKAVCGLHPLLKREFVPNTLPLLPLYSPGQLFFLIAIIFLSV